MRRRILTLAAAAALVAACDEVTVRNSAGQVGLLVDGQAGGAAINDSGRLGSGSGDVEVPIGNLTSAAAPNRNEVIGFGTMRSPRRLSTPWTNGDDSFDLSLGNRLNLGVTVWIVQGPFDTQRAHAIDACVRTSAIWDAERIGVRFSAFTIKDATNDPDITNAILNSTGGDSRNWDDFSDDIGFDANRINIYWINQVEGSTTTGWSDFGARIVMGRNTGDELLAHEIGHSFGLFHPAGCGAMDPDFNATNVMWQCSNTREFLTEGQIFRAHFRANSSINDLYGARPGQPTVGCGGAAETAECPALGRRLWADGTFPANS